MAELTLDDVRARLGVSPGPLKIIMRASEAGLPAGPESLGTPDATVLAAAPTVTAAPPEVTTADTSPKPSEGATDLDTIVQSLWQTESGNRQHDASGKTIVNKSSGAIGVSQLMPETAKGLGVDPYDEEQNRAGGKRYLSQMFGKYGNWRDALGAYVAGPSAYDKWLDGGSKRDSKLGRTITAYQDKVLAQAGIAERGVGAERAPDGSRVLGVADMRAMLGDLPPATDAETEARARLKRDREGGTFIEESTDRAKALTYSLYKGARDFMLAPVQAGLELADMTGVGKQPDLSSLVTGEAPGLAKQLAARVAEADKPWKPLTDKHSYLATAGEIIGGTAALLATARLLGPPVAAGASAIGLTTAMREFAPRVPWLLNSAGGLTTAGRYAAAAPIGAAVTAGTTFTESGDASDRVWLAGLGAVTGPLGVALGQGVAKALRSAATPRELARMMEALKKNAEIVEPDLNYLKSVAVERISKLEQEAAKKYGEATATGAGTRGLEAQVLEDTVGRYRTKAASQIAQTKERLRVEMGLDKEAARRTQHATLQQQYDDQARAVGRLQDEYVDRYIARSAAPEARAAIKRDLGSDPSFPRVTLAPPEPYVAQPVSAEQFMKGRQLLEREKRAAASNRTKREQITGLKQELDRSFAEAARDAGMSARAFYRRLLSADKYYHGQVVPAHDVFEGWFGKRFRGANQIADNATNKLTQGVDGTKIFEKVVQTVETGTAREVAAMQHIFGTTPRDKERLVRSLAFRALTKAEGGIGKDFDPLAVRKYIDDNHRNLARVLTPEQYKWMEGFAKATESLVEQARAATRDDRRFIWSSRVLNILGLERMVHGDVGGGVKLMLSGVFAHTIMNNVPRLRALPVGRLVGRLADLEPGSAEFQRVVRQIEGQIVKSAVVGARAAGDRSGIGDKPTPHFQPLAPMPAAASR